ncbi:MAG: phage holin, LLH family [Sporolactobacillus sp.]|jgi:hypothetical protein|nr:phage holin, LLH family [Sporolactobacillus sp.]
MDEFMIYVVDPAVAALVAGLVAYALKVGLPFIVDLLLRSKAKFLVKAAESKFAGSGRGKEKYQYVADALQAYAKKLIVRIPDKRVQAYVEAAVTELHAELPAALEKAEKQIEDAE